MWPDAACVVRSTVGVLSVIVDNDVLVPVLLTVSMYDAVLVSVFVFTLVVCRMDVLVDTEVRVSVSVNRVVVVVDSTCVRVLVSDTTFTEVVVVGCFLVVVAPLCAIVDAADVVVCGAFSDVVSEEFELECFALVDKRCPLLDDDESCDDSVAVSVADLDDVVSDNSVDDAGVVLVSLFGVDVLPVDSKVPLVGSVWDTVTCSVSDVVRAELDSFP